jgi:hypothetical protein
VPELPLASERASMFGVLAHQFRSDREARRSGPVPPYSAERARTYGGDSWRPRDAPDVQEGSRAQLASQDNSAVRRGTCAIATASGVRAHCGAAGRERCFVKEEARVCCSRPWNVDLDARVVDSASTVSFAWRRLNTGRLGRRNSSPTPDLSS